MHDFDETFESAEPTEEDWLAYCKGKLRKHHPWRRWLLRSKVYMATRTYECNKCFISIHPGDEYLKKVYVCHGRIDVQRFHHWPECPPDPSEDDEEELFDSDSNDSPQVFNFPAQLSRAA